MIGVPGAVAAVVIAVALYFDVRWRKIPNAWTVPAAAAGVAYHVLQSGLRDGGAFAGAGLLVGVGVFLIPFLLGGMGGGDVKLFAALGAWLGWTDVLLLALVAAAAGGIAALAIMAIKGGFGRVRQVPRDLWTLVLTRHRVAPDGKAPRMPYTIPCAVGFAVCLVRAAVLKTWE